MRKFFAILSLASAAWAAPLTVTAPCPMMEAVQNQSYFFQITYTGGTGTVSFALNGTTLPSGLTLDPTGFIAGAPTVTGNFPISVKLTDSVGATAVYNCTLTVAGPLTLTAPCPAPSGLLGVPYSFSVSVTGGVAPITWQLAAGSVLPPGLTLNGSTGVISGTPTQAGAFQFTVIIFDNADEEQVYTCSIVINRFQITAPCPAAAGAVGVPYSFTISVAGTETVQWSLLTGSLPPGLSLNTSTGAITGTPTQTGTYPFSVLVFDSFESSATYSCQIVISTFVLTAACPAASGVVGAPYTFPISVAGSQNETWTLVSGSLPPGLTLNSGNGVISGVPVTSGTYPFSVEIDPIGSVASAPTSGDFAPALLAAAGGVIYSCSIVIAPASLVITTVCPITAAPVTLSATGGSGSYVFSIIGSLPPNLALTGNTISGSLNALPGTYPFTLQVSDGEQIAQKSCSVVVNPPFLQITSGCPAYSIPQGSPVSFTLTAAGGVGDYTWAIQPGLPAGLTLTGNVISGTPTAPPGRYDFTVQVTSGGVTTTIPCSFTITPPLFHITSSCPGSGTVGSPYGPFAVTATGGLGQGTYKFSITGNLPSGVTFDGGTILGTPTAAGTYLFTITASSGQQTVSLAPCSVTIAAASLSLTGNCPGGTIPTGAPVSIPLTVGGGKGPFTYSLSAPKWLTLDTSGVNPTLSGTPGGGDVGSASFSVTVTDSSGATASFRCSIAVAPGPLQIGGSCPANPVLAGSAISAVFQAGGGTEPYNWTLAGNSGLTLAAAQGVKTTVSGNAPADPGNYSFTLTLNDSANSAPATRACNLNVQLPLLQITGTCPASALDLPLSLSVPLSASGGKPPYSWKLNGPSWIGLSSTTGASTSVNSTGAPDATGAFNFGVSLSDSANSTPASFTCSSSINAPPAPGVTITGLTPPATLLQPASAGLKLAAPALLPLTGTVQLSFTSNAFGITDNPQVYFDGGSRTASFSIAPGQTSFSLPNIQQGTVAGTIHLEVTDLKQGGLEVLGTPHPSADLVIARQAPALGITDVTFGNETPTGFDVLISGYSTPRDMKSVTIAFTAAPGSNLTGTTSFTVDVSSLFSQYYGTPASQQVGSMFQNLHIPVTLAGDKSAIAGVAVTLTNSIGNSQTVTKNR